MLKKVEAYCKEQEGHVDIMVLYGRQIPVFPILDKEEIDADAIIICTQEYIKHVKKELGIHSSG